MVFIGLCVVLTASSVSATSTVYVNTTGGNDANTGTIDSPYQTIQKGIGSVDENGTVTIADGTYTGTGNTNITINKNVTITGQSQTGTIINGTDINWIFIITSGVNVTIRNLTFTNGIAFNGGAILNHGILSISDCTFTENTATYWGGAIFGESSSRMSLTDCTFNKNNALHGGGAIAYLSICNVTNCTFMYNSVKGDDSWCGGAIGAYSLSNSTVTGCNFVGNSVDPVSTSFGGGAIYVYNAALTANFNRFYNNSARLGSAFAYNEGMNIIINAENNWWGSSVDPKTVTNLIYGPVDANPWIILTFNAPSTINNGETSAITADFNHINGGDDLVGGHIPDGTPVTYNSTLGSFNPITSTTVNGIATTLFTTNHIGTGNLNATTDNQTVTQLLTVNPASYLYLNTTTSKKNPTVGETFIVTYKLSNKGPDNATNVTVSFQIPAGLEFVNATVDNGTWTYNPANRTITWNLTNVAVGDPYLYLTVKALGSGSYSITPIITSETFNQNNDPLTPFTVNVQAQNNSNTNTVNAVSTTKTIPMQTTGMPIAGLILAILAVLGGIFTPRKK